MKPASLKYLTILLLFIAISINGKPQNKVAQNSTGILTESCKAHPSHSYQLFIPKSDNKPLPLLISIDSHGDGKLAINGFKEAAQKYKVIVAGSNLIKNNDASFMKELEELIADIKSKYQVSNTLYIGGFSGGARMALGYAASHKVNGVIPCGALANPEEIVLLGCPVIAIIGMDDFNFSEAATFVINPAKMPSNLSVITTKASHAWPEKKLLQQALGFLSLSSGSNSNDNLLTDFLKDQKHQIDSLSNTNELYQSALLAHNLTSVALFNKTGNYTSLYSQITAKPQYAEQISKLKQSIEFENKVKEGYYNALMQKDSVWWNREINLLNTKIKTEKDLLTLMAYKRIKGFLGIVCFSLSNRFAGQKDIPDLEKILVIYRLVEPANEDMKNFSKTLRQLKASQSH